MATRTTTESGAAAVAVEDSDLMLALALQTEEAQGDIQGNEWDIADASKSGLYGELLMQMWQQEESAHGETRPTTMDAAATSAESSSQEEAYGSAKTNGSIPANNDSRAFGVASEIHTGSQKRLLLDDENDTTIGSATRFTDNLLDKPCFKRQNDNTNSRPTNESDTTAMEDTQENDRKMSPSDQESRAPSTVPTETETNGLISSDNQKILQTCQQDEMDLSDNNYSYNANPFDAQGQNGTEIRCSARDISDASQNCGFEEETLLIKSSVGRAWKLVERLLILWEVRSNWNSDITPLARDDTVYMAERLVDLQQAWRHLASNSDDLSERPLTVDVGYHWTRPENLNRIRTDGLLTKTERDEMGIDAQYNGSAFGDGVYSAGSPWDFCGRQYGSVCLLVARLTGWCGPYHAREDVDTVVDGIDRMAVLKMSMQCFPIFSFDKGLVASNDPSSAGYEKLFQCHVDVQRILDEFLNEGNESPLPTFERSHRVRPTFPPLPQQPPRVLKQPLKRRRSGFESRLSRVGHNDFEISHIRSISSTRTVQHYVAPDILGKGSAMGESPSAMMIHFKDDTLTCQGFDKGTIIIKYLVKKDKQRMFHPFPNEIHGSLQRIAFLPDNTQGNALLKRLEEAFLKGWTFTVLPKTNEWLPNPVDWIVPHKTLLATGFDGFQYTRNVGRAESGFPDPEYFTYANSVLDGLMS